MQLKRVKKSVLLLVAFLLLLSSASCSSFTKTPSESILTSEVTPPEPTNEVQYMNESISSIVDLKSDYCFEKIEELMPLRGFYSSYVSNFAVDGDSYVYSVGDEIIYKNNENNMGVTFKIAEGKEIEKTSYLEFENNEIYISQIGEGKTYVSKCVLENGSLVSNYMYQLDLVPGGVFAEYFEGDSYYVLLAPNEETDICELRKYNFRIGDFDVEAEPVAVAEIRYAIGFVKLNNNLYVVKKMTGTEYLYSVVDLFNGEQADRIAYDEINALYSDDVSEFVNYLGNPIYVDANGIQEINMVRPYGYTITHSEYQFDVNSDGSIHLLAYNNIYKMVEGTIDPPEVTDRYPRGHFYVIWHPSAVYDTEDGQVATVTIIEPLIYSDEDMEQFCNIFVDSYIELEMNSMPVREMTCGDVVIYAVKSSNGLWTLYHNPNGYFAGIGGGNVWLQIDEVTLKINEDATYNLAIPAVLEEGQTPTPGTILDNSNYIFSPDTELLEYYMNTDGMDTVINVRNNEILDVTFIYTE